MLWWGIPIHVMVVFLMLLTAFLVAVWSVPDYDSNPTGGKSRGNHTTPPGRDGGERKADGQPPVASEEGRRVTPLWNLRVIRKGRSNG